MSRSYMSGDITSLSSNTGMGGGRQDYESFYGLDRHLNYWGFHCHDFYEIYIHFGGGRLLNFDGRTYSLQPRMLMIFPPFIMHGFEGVADLRNYERGFLYISPEVLRSCGISGVDPEQMFRSALATGPNSFILSSADADRCRDLLIDMQRDMDSTDPLMQYENRARMMTFLCIVLRSISNRPEGEPGLTGGGMMREVLDYVNDHYTDALTLQAVADRFSVSTSLLSHEFVRFTNHSVYNYILYKRIILAKQLLHTDRSLSGIAEECGFDVYSNFLRQFRKLEGMSPSAYRKSIRDRAHRGENAE